MHAQRIGIESLGHDLGHESVGVAGIDRIVIVTQGEIAEFHVHFLSSPQDEGPLTTAAPFHNRNTASGAVNCSFNACATARCVSFPSYTLRPLRKWGSSPSARRTPLSASARTNGRVTLLRANVDVRATAPGMLVTQ